MKKEFPLKALVFVVAGILLLTGALYIISINLTGDIVAPNSARCMDSDGGLAVDLPGRCIQYTGGRRKIVSMNEDKCLDTKTLVEYYCNKRSMLTVPTCMGEIVTCPNGCGVYPSEGSRCN